ncbi:MAG: sigma-70 family RNA polymerase sigma factor [Thermoanaerobaculia bacterium]
MPTAEQGQVTRLLLRWRDGDREALEQLTPLIYDELRRLARSYMRDERREPLLQTTALVHEAYLRLVGLDVEWQGRGHFVALCAKMMRRVLVDGARRRNAEKRGGGETPLPIDDEALDRAAEEPVLALHEALQELEKEDARKHQVIELKYFGGAKVTEIAGILDVAPRTVERDLRLGRAWLADHLSSPEALP